MRILNKVLKKATITIATPKTSREDENTAFYWKELTITATLKNLEELK